MKYSKKFIEDLHKIGEWAFVEKNMWVGKLVPEIICDNLQKRGISQEDIEGCVILSVDDAKVLNALISDRNLCKSYPETTESFGKLLYKLIAQAEMSIASTQCETGSKKDEKIDIKQQDKEND